MLLRFWPFLAYGLSVLQNSPINLPTPQKNPCLHLAKSEGLRWSGPYVGGNIGGAWGQSNVTINAGSVTKTAYFSTPSQIHSVNQQGTHVPNMRSLIGGVQLGGNWAYKKLVYGLALDYGAFNLSQTDSRNNISYPDELGTYSLQTSVHTSWLYTVRGRLGWTSETL